MVLRGKKEGRRKKPSRREGTRHPEHYGQLWVEAQDALLKTPFGARKAEPISNACSTGLENCFVIFCFEKPILH